MCESLLGAFFIYTIMIKTYHISKAVKSGGFNFVAETEKVSESIFNDLLSAKIKELLEDKQEQYDEIPKKVIDALDTKTPVTILDRQFEIKFNKK